MRKGFAGILILIGLATLIIAILAWAPWITSDYAFNKAVSTRIKANCKLYTPPPVVYDFITTYPADVQTINFKEYLDFGRSTSISYYCPLDKLIIYREVYFVSLLATTHPITSKNSSYKLAEDSNEEDVLETANWKTYTNKNFKISFKYPNNFYQGDDFGENYFYQLRFSTCEFKKENGAEVEQRPECPSFGLGMSLGKTTDQYDLVNNTEVGGGSIDESFGSSGTLTYKRSTDLNTSAGKWLRYETEAGGNLVPKYSYGVALRKGNNDYSFKVSSESKNIVDSNIKVLEQIVSTFKFLD